MIPSSIYDFFLFEEWTAISDINKPVIAAVNGFALGTIYLYFILDIIYCFEATLPSNYRQTFSESLSERAEARIHYVCQTFIDP